MNYGAHVGTGAGAGGGLAAYGLQTGSTLMLIFALVLAIITVIGVARRVKRSAATQRP